MALTVSPAVKIFTLIGVVIALLMAAAFFLMGGAQETVAASEPLPALPSKKAGIAATPAVVKKPAASAAARAKKPAVPAGKVVEPKPAKPRATAKNGLPMSIARALTANDIVVVSLYGAGWKIDPMARDEAAAGARAAGAGFVALDVTSASSAAEALMLKYDAVFRAPAVLVFRRGGELATQLDGFRDRATVAQAATNARS